MLQEATILFSLIMVSSYYTITRVVVKKPRENKVIIILTSGTYSCMITTLYFTMKYLMEAVV